MQYDYVHLFDEHLSVNGQSAVGAVTSAAQLSSDDSGAYSCSAQLPQLLLGLLQSSVPVLQVLLQLKNQLLFTADAFPQLFNAGVLKENFDFILMHREDSWVSTTYTLFRIFNCR